jgi:hypothetical protein
MIMTHFLNSISDDARLAPPCFGAAFVYGVGAHDTVCFLFWPSLGLPSHICSPTLGYHIESRHWCLWARGTCIKPAALAFDTLTFSSSDLGHGLLPVPVPSWWAWGPWAIGFESVVTAERIIFLFLVLYTQACRWRLFWSLAEFRGWGH